MDKTQQNDDQTVVEDVTDDVTTSEPPKAEAETEATLSLEDALAQIATLEEKLSNVTKESIKRKEKIRALTAELETAKTTTVTDAAVAEENKTLKAQVGELKGRVRGFEVGSKVNGILAAKKMTLSDEQAREDLRNIIASQIKPDWDDDDIAENLDALVTAEVKKRPYLLLKKKAPEIDARTQSTSDTIPDSIIEDVASSFNIQVQ